jgi:iron-sulfur cluster assembly protein
MGLFSGFKVVSAGLRLGIEKGGCAGMSYKMDYVNDPDPKDDVVEDHGVKIYVDPKASLFLLGTVMDFKTTKLTSGFVFQNPNEISACGCGESVNLVAADEGAATASH